MISAPAAAKLVGVSLNTIHRRIDAKELAVVGGGEVPGLKRKRPVMLNRAEVEALFSAKPDTIPAPKP